MTWRECLSALRDIIKQDNGNQQTCPYVRNHLIMYKLNCGNRLPRAFKQVVNATSNDRVRNGDKGTFTAPMAALLTPCRTLPGSQLVP